MHLSAREAANGFRHICRRLEAGESVPRLPSLVEQLNAFANGLQAVAAEPVSEPTEELLVDDDDDDAE